MQIQDAEKADAKDLAQLINLAGEGIPAYLWSLMADATLDPLEFGALRAAREEGGFSYRNARVVREGAVVAAMVISYQLEDPYVIDDLEEVPEVVRPLILLESKAPGSWYVNALATVESQRGKGIATRLLEDAEVKARTQGVTEMSLIVASENRSARALYMKQGYTLRASLPVIPCPAYLHGGQWELMTKTLVLG